ncbi:MAG TPA: hypothetical protein VD862_01935 [Candidatus Paceibacterota bacterium]|nr:hypothetical protein [Candidatus Paceibacterota bacterium]
MPETNAERLRRLIRLLPVDDVQLGAALAGAGRLSDERAEELADRLQEIYDRLPVILEQLEEARTRTSHRVRGKK